MNRSDLERDQRKPVIHTTGLPFSASQHMTTTCETTKEKKKKKKNKKEKWRHDRKTKDSEGCKERHQWESAVVTFEVENHAPNCISSARMKIREIEPLISSKRLIITAISKDRHLFECYVLAIC